MAEHYETGSASNVNDLLDKVRNAMVAHGGYVQQSHTLDGTSGGYRSHLSKGTLRVNLRSGFNGEVPAGASERSVRYGSWAWNGNSFAPDYIAVNLSTGFDFSKSWHNQPGAPGASENRGMASMINAKGSISRYWLFILEDPDTVILFVEVYPNKFNHLAFGMLNLVQQIEDGGEWFSGSRALACTTDRVNEAFSGYYGTYTGSSPSTIARSEMTAMFRVVDSRGTQDDLDGWGLGFMDNGTLEHSGGINPSYGKLVAGLPQYNGRYRGAAGVDFLNALTESWIAEESRSIVMPINCWKQIVGGGWTLIGTVPHVGRTSMAPYLAGDQLAGLGETWLAFPSHTRMVPLNKQVYSQNSSPAYPPNDIFNHFGIGVAVRRP